MLGHDFVPDPIHASRLRYHGMVLLVRLLIYSKRVITLCRQAGHASPDEVLYASIASAHTTPPFLIFSQVRMCGAAPKQPCFDNDRCLLHVMCYVTCMLPMQVSHVYERGLVEAISIPQKECFEAVIA
jgi:predicted alternative tryptophan synthase beta-subunit